MRLTLIEESIQSFAEIPAHVAHENEVFALLAREPASEPRERLLGGTQCERRVAGDQLRQFIDPPFQRRQVLDHLVEQSDASRLLGSDEPGSEYEILDARRSNQRGEPADARQRKAIAERARDRKSDSRRLCPDAQIATSGDAAAAAGAGAGDRGD